jgi:hypothetical protein
MIESLFHITHVDNLVSIHDCGLLSRHAIETEELPYHDLSDPGCQARRSDRCVGTDHVDLHNFVPLFINPRNPMLYRLQKNAEQGGETSALAILEFGPQPAHWRASLISDGIASSGASQLFHATDPQAQEALDWEAIGRRSWVDGPADTGRKKMAEVLVSEVLLPYNIKRIWLQNAVGIQRLEALLPAKAMQLCEIDRGRRLFF